MFDTEFFSAVSAGSLNFDLAPFCDLDVAGFIIQSESASLNLPQKDPFDAALSTQAQTLRWIEHNFDPATHQQPLVRWWVCELARVCIPAGSVGILNGIEQVLFDANGNYYATEAARWGVPFGVLNDLNAVRWWLQVDYYDGIQPTRINYESPGPIQRDWLPGVAFAELPEINGLWFPANSAQCTIKAVLEASRMLRLFVWVPPCQFYQWTAAGRLRATVQSLYCSEALSNVRKAK